MTRETTKNVDDVFSAFAARKAEAAAFRGAGTPTDVEPARDVYRNACAAVAAEFQPLGFRYAKSAQRFSRSSGGFVCTVSFQSSHNNIPGRHVRLWMHATVRSKTLETWRAQRLPPALVNDFVAGGMVHRLRGVHAMVEWELAVPTDRAAVIADAIAFVRSDVLPYFELFDTPSDLIACLVKHEVPAFDLQPSVEFSMCFGCAEDGQRVLDRFVRQRPDLGEQIAACEREGLPRAPYGPANFAESVNFLRRTYGLR